MANTPHALKSETTHFICLTDAKEQHSSRPNENVIMVIAMKPICSRGDNQMINNCRRFANQWKDKLAQEMGISLRVCTVLGSYVNSVVFWIDPVP